MKQRKTGKDYGDEYKDLTQRLKSLEVHIEKRLMEIKDIYPEAPVFTIGDTEFKAKGLVLSWIQGLSMDDKIKYLKNIEDWGFKNSKIVQTSFVL